jgi:hypothetical protein
MTDMLHMEGLTATRLLLSEEAVDAYLTDHGLQEGACPVRAVLLQLHGTTSGQPAVMFVVEVDGKKVIAKITLNTLIAVTGGMRAGAEREGWRQPP